jgi:copper chaperone CopZ
MLLKNLLLIAAILLLPLMLSAESIKMKVDGMVCQSCVETISAMFKKHESTKSINVDLNSKTVTVETLDEKTFTDEDLKKIIKDSGYELQEVIRAAK